MVGGMVLRGRLYLRMQKIYTFPWRLKIPVNRYDDHDYLRSSMHVEIWCNVESDSFTGDRGTRLENRESGKAAAKIRLGFSSSFSMKLIANDSPKNLFSFFPL